MPEGVGRRPDLGAQQGFTVGRKVDGSTQSGSTDAHVVAARDTSSGKKRSPGFIAARLRRSDGHSSERVTSGKAPKEADAPAHDNAQDPILIIDTKNGPWEVKPVPRGSQPALPGLDRVSLAKAAVDDAVGSFTHDWAVREERNARENGVMATIHTAQDLVWQKHCEEELPDHQNTWRVVVDAMRGTTPRYGFQLYAPSDIKGTWRFVSVREAEAVQIITEIRTTADENELPEEMLQARKYLDNPTRGAGCPEELLGVSATGKPNKRVISTEELQKAYNQRFTEAYLDSLSSLTAKVTLEGLGANVHAKKEIEKVRVEADWHDPNERPNELDHNYAWHIMRRFYGHNNDDPVEKYDTPIDPDKLIEYLESEANAHNEAYKKLEIIAGLLAESTIAHE